MKYSAAIGIDTHGKSNTIYAIDTKTGAFTETALSANPEEAIRWIARQGFDGPMMAVYESGLTGFGLARALMAADIPCQVAAVSKLPERRDKKKNDREDVKHLAKQLIADEVHPVWIPSPKHEALRKPVASARRGRLLRALGKAEGQLVFVTHGNSLHRRKALDGQVQDLGREAGVFPGDGHLRLP